MTRKDFPRGRLLTVGEVCSLLGYARQTVYNKIWSGAGVLAGLPYYRIGRSIRFAEQDINAFLQQRRVEPRTAHRVDPETVPAATTTRKGPAR